MSVSTDTERIFRIGGYVKRAKLNLRNEREIRAFHRNTIERRFGDFEDGTLVDVYIDITGYKETAKRPEMLRLMRDCADGKVNLIFAETKGYLSANTRELLDIHCEAVVDGYTDFIFLNRFGQPQHQATLNKAIRRIIRDCNDEQLLKDENAKILLPHFSCHSLRHTFTTRMCEAGVNVKVIQDTLGHKDISTTLNIYTDVTKELRRSEFEGLDSYFKNEYNKAANI